MRPRVALLTGLTTALLSQFLALGQEAPQSALPPLPPVPVRVRTNLSAFPVSGFPGAATPARPLATASVPKVVSAPDSLKFDAKEKTVNVKTGEQEAKFVFAVTNVSKQDVVIMSVHTSCGCTAAKLPSTPWVIKPGEGGEIGATMNLAGKYGTVTKTVTVVSSAGSIPLIVKSVLPQEAYAAMQRMTERSRNLQIAAADRQVVFRGDCARCHVETSVGKHGAELYNAACGVCHDAEHRATMVPQLRGRKGEFSKEYWNLWARNGKEGSLMPAFDTRKGGPLTDDQLESLATYLATEFPKEALPPHLKPVPSGVPVQQPASIVTPITVPPAGKGPAPAPAIVK
jgi:mono/diheme cytochrome c family protein